MNVKSAMERNLSVLKWCYAFNKTPMYFFAAIYYYELTGSFAMVGSLFGLLSITKILMEVPTGVISDKYLGRKGTFIAGGALKTLGFICNLLGLVHIGFLFLGEVLFGTYAALESGNTSSLLYESLQKEKKASHYQEYFGKNNSYMYVFWGFLLLLAGFLTYQFGLYMAAVISLVQTFIYASLGFFLTEPYPNRKLEKKTFADGYFHLKESLSVLRQNKNLRFLTVVFALRHGAIYSCDRFFSLFYKKFLSLNVLGLLFAASLFVSSIVSKYANKIILKLGFKRSFIITDIITVPLQLFAFIFPGVHSPFIIEAAADLNPIQNVAKSSILHKNFTDEQRATLESLFSICGSLFLALCIFLLGLAADAWGLETALIIAALYRLILIPVYNKTIKD